MTGDDSPGRDTQRQQQDAACWGSFPRSAPSVLHVTTGTDYCGAASRTAPALRERSGGTQLLGRRGVKVFATERRSAST